MRIYCANQIPKSMLGKMGTLKIYGVPVRVLVTPDPNKMRALLRSLCDELELDYEDEIKILRDSKARCRTVFWEGREDVSFPLGVAIDRVRGQLGLPPGLATFVRAVVAEKGD